MKLSNHKNSQKTSKTPHIKPPATPANGFNRYFSEK
jgi:hypothetical protein